MKGFLSFLNLRFIPKSPDFALLFVRAGLGVGIMILHGWHKVQLLTGWGGSTPANEKARLDGIAKFPDPLHIGASWSLGLTAFAEVVCAALLIIGFCTRFAAMTLCIAMGVAFFLVHKHVINGPGFGELAGLVRQKRFDEALTMASAPGSGELAAIYLLGFAAILIAGPGRFSFDGSASAPVKAH